MSDTPSGSIAWIDLTVADADGVRDFYKEVVGWDFEGCDMDGGAYQDYSMMPAGTGQAVAGICHAKGGNAGMPPSWMLYITVPDLDAALDKCKQHGGEIVLGPKGEQARFCVIRDPAGAVCALWETKT
jgi:predicted enzyme related to lactoylglutathione lyase